MRLLLISTDSEHTRYLRKGLEQAGYLIDPATDAHEGLLRMADSDYDAVVVEFEDANPDVLELAAQLAEAALGDPVITLTRTQAAETRVQLLRAGADLVIPQPVAFSEFVARLEATLRRRHKRQSLDKFECGELMLDNAIHQASWRRVPLLLRRREFLILECLARHSERVVERQEIIDYVWGSDFEPKSSVVDLYVSRLRQKIQGVPGAPALVTVPGHGYRLVLDPDRPNTPGQPA